MFIFQLFEIFKDSLIANGVWNYSAFVTSGINIGLAVSLCRFEICWSCTLGSYLIFHLSSCLVSILSRGKADFHNLVVHFS